MNASMSCQQPTTMSAAELQPPCKNKSEEKINMKLKIIELLCFLILV